MPPSSSGGSGCACAPSPPPRAMKRELGFVLQSPSEISVSPGRIRSRRRVPDPSSSVTRCKVSDTLAADFDSPPMSPIDTEPPTQPLLPDPFYISDASSPHVVADLIAQHKEEAPQLSDDETQPAAGSEADAPLEQSAAALDAMATLLESAAADGSDNGDELKDRNLPMHAADNAWVPCSLPAEEASTPATTGWFKSARRLTRVLSKEAMLGGNPLIPKQSKEASSGSVFLLNKPQRRLAMPLLRTKVETNLVGPVKKMEMKMSKKVACLTVHPANIRELTVIYMIPRKNGNSLHDVLRTFEKSPLEVLEKVIHSSNDAVVNKDIIDFLNYDDHIPPSSRTECIVCHDFLESKQPEDHPTPSYTYKTNSRQKYFNNAVYDERTVIHYDQCEKRHHTGCLQSQWHGDVKVSREQHLKELPEGEWFCCSSCSDLRSSLVKIMFSGALLCSESDIRTKILCMDTIADLRWQLLSGRIGSQDGNLLLSAAVPIFHQCFDPIIKAHTGRGLIPEMINGSDKFIAVTAAKLASAQVLQLPDVLLLKELLDTTRLEPSIITSPPKVLRHIIDGSSTFSPLLMHDKLIAVASKSAFVIILQEPEDSLSENLIETASLEESFTPKPQTVWHNTSGGSLLTPLSLGSKMSMDREGSFWKYPAIGGGPFQSVNEAEDAISCYLHEQGHRARSSNLVAGALQEETEEEGSAEEPSSSSAPHFNIQDSSNSFSGHTGSTQRCSSYTTSVPIFCLVFCFLSWSSYSVFILLIDFWFTIMALSFFSYCVSWAWELKRVKNGGCTGKEEEEVKEERNREK